MKFRPKIEFDLRKLWRWRTHQNDDKEFLFGTVKEILQLRAPKCAPRAKNWDYAYFDMTKMEKSRDFEFPVPMCLMSAYQNDFSKIKNQLLAVILMGMASFHDASNEF